MYQFIFSVLFIFTTSIANVSQANEQQEYCASWKDIARAAMTARQAGVPLRTMLNLVSDETAINIYQLAYESPRQNTEADKQISIDKFSESVVLQCFMSIPTTD